jgi:hypothetical protein
MRTKGMPARFVKGIAKPKKIKSKTLGDSFTQKPGLAKRVNDSLNAAFPESAVGLPKFQPYQRTK